MDLTPDSLTGLGVALGLGLLIGVERERRKGTGPTRHFAGLRTFTLVSLAGAVAQLLEQPLLTFVAGALVATLAAGDPVLPLPPLPGTLRSRTVPPPIAKADVSCAATPST